MRIPHFTLATKFKALGIYMYIWCIDLSIPGVSVSSKFTSSQSSSQVLQTPFPSDG